MINILGKLAIGLVAPLSFFTAFIATGDVLVAIAAAIAVAAAQFTVSWSTQRRIGVSSWAGLAVVLTVTATTLAGVDAGDLGLSPTPVDCTAIRCACQTPQFI